MTAENTANDYVVAKALSGYVKSIFSIVESYQLIGPEEEFNPTELNRVYVLLINQLEILYERSPKLANISPEPTWKRFEVIKNHLYSVQKYLEKNSDFGIHIDKIDKLCIISGEKEPEFSTDQQEIIDTAKSVIEAHNKLIAATAQRIIDENEEKIKA